MCVLEKIGSLRSPGFIEGPKGEPPKAGPHFESLGEAPNRFTHCLGTLHFFLAGIFFSCNGPSPVPATLEQAKACVWVEGGKYRMGNEGVPDAFPRVEQEIPGFWMQKYEVTYAQFQEFVHKTGYVTLAERNGGSYVFDPAASADSFSVPGAFWWTFKPGASWKNPMGKKGINPPDDHMPVTHVAYEDACAYCDWLGMRLPTEAEWEYAAKTNGDVPGKNVWQGNFPYEHHSTDGFEYASPVGSFPAGKNGLHDLNGNVWEWCSDYYHAGWYGQASSFSEKERIKGPEKPYDPSMPYDTSRVIRGGSYLCAENYCRGYLPYARMRSDVKMSFGHIGFRCVKKK